MKRKVYLCALFIISFFAASSQPEWIHAMQEPGASFYTIRDAFYRKHRVALVQSAQPKHNARLSELPSKENEDYNMIKFRRWEWYWSSRIHPDGSFPAPAEIYAEYTKAIAGPSAATQARVPTAAQANWVNISRTANSGGYWGMGRTSSIAFHPAQGGTFWVTAPMGGVWKTTNGGQSYTPLGDQLPYLGAGSIVVDYGNANNIYVCTGDHTGDNSLGIYKSTDGGSTWLPTGLSNSVDAQYAFYNLVQSPSSPQTLLAASNRGLYRTTNGGTSWTRVSTSRCTDVEYAPNDGNVVFAVLATKINRSIDGGTTFTQVLDMGSMSSGATVRIAVTKADPNRVIAWSGNGLWVSTDGGSNWTKKTFPPDGYMESMLISPNNPDILYAGNVDIFRSNDAGTNWTKIGRWCCGTPSLPEVHADHRNLAYSAVTNEIFSLNDGGVDKYNETTGTWTRLSNGLVIPQYYSAASAATNANLIGVGSQDNGGSRRAANLNWLNTNGGDAGTQAIDPANSNICYSNYNPSPAIIRTTDGWTSTVEVRPKDSPLVSWWIIPYVLDPNNASSILAGYHAVYRSNNRGDTWTKISPDFTTAGEYWQAIRAVAVAPSNSGTIYASRPRTIYFTSDSGANWGSYTFNFADITSICVRDNDPKTVYVTFGQLSNNNKVYRSADGGATWVNFSAGLPNVPVNHIVYQKNSDELLYVATDFGVYYRDASMTIWQKYGNGLPATRINHLHIQYSAEKLRAATFARGIYETDILESVPRPTAVDPNPNEPVIKSVISVHPNPARGRVIVRYTHNDVPQDGVLQVADMYGRTIKEQKVMLSKGDNSFTLSTAVFSGGLYTVIITMRKSDRRVTHRLEVMK